MSKQRTRTVVAPDGTRILASDNISDEEALRKYAKEVEELDRDGDRLQRELEEKAARMDAEVANEDE